MALGAPAGNAKIESNDQRRVRLYGCGQYVPVFRIVGHAIHERRETGNPSVTEVGAQFGFKMCRQ